MSCCLENAVLDALRALDCSSIRPENHFLNVRQCTDCVPYLVLSVTRQQGLRTSEGVQFRDAIAISAYFKGAHGAKIREYRDLVEEWMSSSDCIELGDCGCLCVVNVARSVISVTSNGLLRYQAQFTGRYNAVSSANSESS
jgi:hypothetical protein